MGDYYMSSRKTYILHIDGLKGLACVMIMVGHYIGLYRFAEYFPGELTGFGSFLNSKLGFILDEQFYVKLFFIISGYLVSKSSIDSKKKLLKKCVQRFLRLGLPVLFAYGIIWVLYQTIGFYTAETENFVMNTWFQTMYLGEFQIVDVFKSPIDVLFLNKYDWNAPYWVLREMFYASLIIYVFNYLKTCMKKDIILVLVAAGLIVGYIGIYDVGVACLIGMLLSWMEKDDKKYIVILIALGAFVVYKGYYSWVFFCLLIKGLPKIEWLKKLFSSKAMLFLGKISFGIYSFHWPVFCSLGMIIFMKTCGVYGAVIVLIVSGICTTVLTIVISIVYYYVFEKQTYQLIGKM